MKKIIDILFAGTFAVVCVSCNAENNMILEYKDVQFFKAIENIGVTSPGTTDIALTKLKISGLAFHSALVVKKIESEVDGQLLTVYVYLGQAKQGLSGSFSYELIVPELVTEVRFGKDGPVIWTRQKTTKGSNNVQK